MQHSWFKVNRTDSDEGLNSYLSLTSLGYSKSTLSPETYEEWTMISPCQTGRKPVYILARFKTIMLIIMLVIVLIIHHPYLYTWFSLRNSTVDLDTSLERHSIIEHMPGHAPKAVTWLTRSFLSSYYWLLWQLWDLKEWYKLTKVGYACLPAILLYIADFRI